MKGRWLVVAVALLCLAWPVPVPAQDQNKDDGFWHYDRNEVYGWELMSPEERWNYRQQIRDLETEAERERFRDNHRQAMQERSRLSGVPLPEEAAPNSWSEPESPAEKGRKWPNDGLRRWPDGETRSQFHRWPPQKQPPAAAPGLSGSRYGSAAASSPWHAASPGDRAPSEPLGNNGPGAEESGYDRNSWPRPPSALVGREPGR